MVADLISNISSCIWKGGSNWYVIYMKSMINTNREPLPGFQSISANNPSPSKFSVYIILKYNNKKKSYDRSI